MKRSHFTLYICQDTLYSRRSARSYHYVPNSFSWDSGTDPYSKCLLKRSTYSIRGVEHMYGTWMETTLYVSRELLGPCEH